MDWGQCCVDIIMSKTTAIWLLVKLSKQTRQVSDNFKDKQGGKEEGTLNYTSNIALMH